MYRIDTGPVQALAKFASAMRDAARDAERAFRAFSNGYARAMQRDVYHSDQTVGVPLWLIAERSYDPRRAPRVLGPTRPSSTAPAATEPRDSKRRRLRPWKGSMTFG